MSNRPSTAILFSSSGRDAPVQWLTGSGEPRSGNNSQQPQRADPVASAGERRRSRTETSGRRDSPAGEESRRTARTGLQELLIELEREQLGCDTIENAFFSAPLDVAPRERSAEYRAWQLLQFASLLPAAGFDEALASQGWYSSTYQQHSDRGLAEIKEKPPSSRTCCLQGNWKRWEFTTNRFFTAQPRQQPISLYE